MCSFDPRTPYGTADPGGMNSDAVPTSGEPCYSYSIEEKSETEIIGSTTCKRGIITEKGTRSVIEGLADLEQRRA